MKEDIAQLGTFESWNSQMVVYVLHIIFSRLLLGNSTAIEVRAKDQRSKQTLEENHKSFQLTTYLYVKRAEPIGNLSS